ncbi:MAG: hypothetical protein ACLUNO_10990 [Oscillospiraceae bacterium]
MARADAPARRRAVRRHVRAALRRQGLRRRAHPQRALPPRHPARAVGRRLQELPEQDEQIDALLRRRLRSDTPDRDELRRASDYLYRRGFGRDEIRAAIARYQDNFEEY